jgi:hypothetical protein
MTRAIRQLLLAFTLVVAATAVLAAPASAGWKEVLQDCILNDGLQGDYTRAELIEAKQNVTGERIAYTECNAEISAAMNAAAVNGGDDDGPGASKSSADADGDGIVTPEEKKAAKRKKAREAREIASVTDTLQPDDAATIGGDDSSGGNLGLILAIAALALLAVGGGTWYAARRNPAIANALRRVPLLGRRS